MKKTNEKMINIDGDRFKTDVSVALKTKLGITMADASEKLLRKNKSYISQSCIFERFDAEAYETLCLILNLDGEKYKTTEKKEEETKPQKTIYNEDIVVGINSVYNLLNQLLSETKTTNQLLREVLRKQDGDHTLLKTINESTNKAAEKTTSIYTDVHYNILKLK